MSSNEGVALRFAAWVNQVVGGMTDVEVTERVATISANTVGNWRRPKRAGQLPDPRRVVDFAKAFNLDKLEALYHAGVLDESDLSGNTRVDNPRPSLEAASAEELLEAALARVRGGEAIGTRRQTRQLRARTDVPQL